MFVSLYLCKVDSYSPGISEDICRHLLKSFLNYASLPQFTLPWVNMRLIVPGHVFQLTLYVVTLVKFALRHNFTLYDYSEQKQPSNFLTFLVIILSLVNRVLVLVSCCLACSQPNKLRPWEAHRWIFSVPHCRQTSLHHCLCGASLELDCSPVITLLAKSHLSVCVCLQNMSVCVFMDRQEWKWELHRYVCWVQCPRKRKRERAPVIDGAASYPGRGYWRALRDHRYFLMLLNILLQSALPPTSSFFTFSVLQGPPCPVPLTLPFVFSKERQILFTYGRLISPYTKLSTQYLTCGRA